MAPASIRGVADNDWLYPVLEVDIDSDGCGERHGHEIGLTVADLCLAKSSLLIVSRDYPTELCLPEDLPPLAISLSSRCRLIDVITNPPSKPGTTAT